MIIKRYDDNPILSPDRNKIWQMNAVFNCCPVKIKDEFALLYRAESSDYFHTYANRNMVLSNIGLSFSKDGIKFKGSKKFIFTANEWDKYGCEDPRITKLKNKYYIFYTALSKYPFESNGIKVAVAITKDLKKIDKRKLVTPFNSKAMSLFPEKIDNKMWVVFSFHTDSPPTKFCLAAFDKEEDLWSQKYWSNWYKNHENYVLNLKRSEKDHVEAGAPPLKTEYGWLLFYSYIKDYFSENPIFGIEAVLLDLKNPFKIISRTEGPILVPEEYYETTGRIPNIVFPSGAMIVGNKIYLYYGSADTTCSLAFIDKKSFLNELTMDNKLRELKLKRYSKNPIISPNKKNPWENKATFNPAAIYLDNKVHILYRAMSENNTSVIGYATSKNGFKIDYRSDKPAYAPRENFELKLKEKGFSGCEDPRITKIGEVIYMLYTAYDSMHNPRVALTSIKKSDFLKENWRWKKSQLISPQNTDNKDACLFPEKIRGKYYILHRNGTGIDLSKYEKLEFEKENYLQETKWMSKRKGWWDSQKIGSAAPPIKTKKGWLVLYHGISEDNSYSVGAFLLDLKNPFKVIARTGSPIFTPEKSYEKDGHYSNVVFPCGVVQIKDILYVYYGGADKYVAVATIKLNDLLNKLEAHKVDE
jgi:beta-1,2-mannobiose phosphorylase / 1,2-beta-oligomannan phosphorylase